ncbi:MAG: hypothetical protein ACPG4U_05310 [Pseudomonadales bacterium]
MLDNRISLNSPHPRVQTIPASKLVGINIMAEASDLKRLGLIGEDSSPGGTFSTQGSVIHWSKEDYQQWLAYRADGSDAALQAADYQTQMREERIALSSDYLGKVYDLATDFSKLEGVQTSFANYLDYHQGEKDKPALGAREEAAIDAFWERKASEITALDESFDALKAFPQDLNAWLNSRDFAVDDAVHQKVDELRNAWVEQRSDQGVDAQYAPQQVLFDNPRGEGAVVAQHSDASKLYSSLDGLKLELGQAEYQSWGSSTALFEEAAREHQNNELVARYHEMNLLKQGLSTDFNLRFGTEHGNPDFSIQDMVDNYNAGRPLGQLDDGSMHPRAAQIEQFWQQNQFNLELYSYKQQQIDSPMSLDDYQRIYAERIKSYFQDNIDYFLNKKLPREYQV